MAYKHAGDILLKSYNRMYDEVSNMLKKFKVLKNPNCVQILNILGEKGKQTISELQKETGLKTFNSAFLNVKRLEKNGFVITEKDNRSQGQPRYVDLHPETKKQLELKKLINSQDDIKKLKKNWNKQIPLIFKK